MTDTPGREPEQRLPVPRPPVEPAPVERFSSPPSTRAVELTPERAAQIVRQSSNARWVGFLAVVIVILFVTVYWFYELAPLGFREPRLDAEADVQQVTAVERGYNLYQANCARCHGANGEGGIGPALNRQDKLFAHLTVDYLNNMLIAGGRYVCGNANSIMPVWSNEGRPARSAQLHPDRGPDRVHPGAQRPDVHDPRPRARGAEATTRSPARSRPSTAGSTRTTSRPRARRRTRPAGPTEFATASAAPSGPPARIELAGRVDRRERQKVSLVASGIKWTTPDLTVKAGAAIRHRLRQPGRRHAAQRRDQGRDGGRRLQERHLQRRGDARASRSRP